MEPIRGVPVLSRNLPDTLVLEVLNTADGFMLFCSNHLHLTLLWVIFCLESGSQGRKC